MERVSKNRHKNDLYEEAVSMGGDGGFKKTERNR